MILRLTFLLLLSSPAWATWTHIQTVTNTSCANPCVTTVASTGTSNLLTVSTMDNGAVTITSASGGGTWVVPSSPSCDSDDATAGGTACAYVLSSTSGATSITVNFSAAGTCCVVFREFSTTQAPAIFDTAGTRDQSTAATSIPGVALTLAGSGELIVQHAIAQGTMSAIDGSYVGTFPVGNGAAYIMNTASGSAPNWTSTSGRAALGAMAFKESATTPIVSGASVATVIARNRRKIWAAAGVPPSRHRVIISSQ